MGGVAAWREEHNSSSLLGLRVATEIHPRVVTLLFLEGRQVT
jgi:hypothetical protein